MTLDPAMAALGALLCGAAGAAVPNFVRRLPGPPGEVAALPGLRRRTVVLAGAAGLLVGASLGTDWALLYLLPLVPVSVALAIVDRHTHLLPTRVIWPTLGATAVLAALSALLADDLSAYLRAVVCGVAVLGCFHALWWIHPAGLGYGDVRLSAVVGFALGYLGWAALVVGVYGGFLAFSGYGLARAAVRRDRRALRTPLPFGPFLLAGALAGVVLGDPLGRYLVSG